MISINGSKLNITLFPDNTSQVWKIKESLLSPPTGIIRIEWRYSHEGELIQLAQLKALLDVRQMFANLYIPYLPYGRQDKLIANDSTFALRVFAKILNGMNFERIAIQDPHSQIALSLINNSIAVYPYRELDAIFKYIKPDYVCYPDAGATVKYSKIYPYNYIWAEKSRDQSTGYIKYSGLSTQVRDLKILIVDDICDGGMTFKLLAKMLLEKGASEVNLFVTHGLFTKGLKTLKDSGINRIFEPRGEVVEKLDYIYLEQLK